MSWVGDLASWCLKPKESPLILSFSPWEKGPLHNGSGIVPSPAHIRLRIWARSSGKLAKASLLGRGTG